MAGLNMSRAFNSRMLSKLVRYEVLEGHYDDDNNWVKGATRKSTVFGVVLSGNKFSQFEEGQAKVSEDGGIRISDYKTLYIKDKYNLQMNDKIFYAGVYYNVLQRSDEYEYNFRSFILEKSEDWKP
jgi:hypothetical protein